MKSGPYYNTDFSEICICKLVTVMKASVQYIFKYFIDLERKKNIICTYKIVILIRHLRS